MQHAMPRLFLDHFAATSFVQERDGAVGGVLVGFFSPTQPETADIHFIGVDPDHRGAGFASGLYASFFDAALADGRSEVRCITSQMNAASIAFHSRLGFDIVPSDRLAANVPVHSDYDGPGKDRVCFRKRLTLTGARPSLDKHEHP